MEENPNNHLGCKKNSKYWDKLPTSTVAGFFASTLIFLLFRALTEPENFPQPTNENSKSWLNKTTQFQE